MVPVNVTGKTATSPVLMATNEASGQTVDAFYAVTIDSYVFPGSANVSSQSFGVLDTGTSLTTVPSPVRLPYLPFEPTFCDASFPPPGNTQTNSHQIAQALNAQFKPPAVVDNGTFVIDCNAKAPPFAVQIGGVQFSVDGTDLIFVGGTDENGNDVCISGVQDGGPDDGSGLFIL
jgi:hypothetical protein